MAGIGNGDVLVATRAFVFKVESRLQIKYWKHHFDRSSGQIVGDEHAGGMCRVTFPAAQSYVSLLFPDSDAMCKERIIMRRPAVTPLIVLSVIAAIIFAATAFNWAKIAGQLSPEQMGIGSTDFWYAHLRAERLGLWAFFALLIGLDLTAIAVRRRVTPWPVLCGIVAILCGIAALNWNSIAWSFSQSPGVVGSPLFWAAYMRSHYWVGGAFLALLAGLAIAGIAFLMSTSDNRRQRYKEELTSPV